MFIASFLEDIVIRIPSTYLVKKVHVFWQVLSAVRFNLSMYMMANGLDHIGRLDGCL